MKRKKGFTLLELMVTLSIFSILTLMISAMLIQSQKILVKADKSSQIQNEVRVALLKIQTEAKNEDYDEIVVSDNGKYGYINNKWEITESTSSDAREILRFIDNDNNLAKVYVEVYDEKNNTHELVKFIINKTTGEIKPNSRETLISNIQGTEVNKIKVSTEDIIDSNGKLVTINCTDITSQNVENEAEYIISFATIYNEDIELDFNILNESNSTQNGDSDNNTGSGSSNEVIEEDKNDSTVPPIDESSISDWDSNKIYYEGDIVKYNGLLYKAFYYNQGRNPEEGNAWVIITEEPTVWKSTKTYLKDQKVIYNEIRYQAAYENTNNNPEVGNAWTIISKEPTEWKVTKVYLKDQKVTFNGKIYKNTSDWNQGNNPESGNGWIIIS